MLAVFQAAPSGSGEPRTGNTAEARPRFWGGDSFEGKVPAHSVSFQPRERRAVGLGAGGEFGHRVRHDEVLLRSLTRVDRALVVTAQNLAARSGLAAPLPARGGLCGGGACGRREPGEQGPELLAPDGVKREAPPTHRSRGTVPSQRRRCSCTPGLQGPCC